MLARTVRSGSVLGLLLVAVAISHPAGADTITIPVPELLGDFSSNPAIAIHLDVEFIEIIRVSLSVTASGTPDVFQRCLPDGCTEFAIQPSLLFQFNREETLPIRLIFAATPEFSSDPATLLVDIPDSRGSPRFEFLLDGQGQFGAFFNGVLFIPEDPVSQLSEATLFVTHAELTVTGTLVPEPGTAALVLLGLGALSYQRRGSTP